MDLALGVKLPPILPVGQPRHFPNRTDPILVRRRLLRRAGNSLPPKSDDGLSQKCFAAR